MGQSKSKEGRRKKTPKNQQQPTESSDPSDPNAPAKVDDNASHTDGDTEGNTNDDESSSSGVEDNNELEENSVIFSKNKQVVTKDDFELLTVIGKGSFGKVNNHHLVAYCLLFFPSKSIFRFTLLHPHMPP
jgi:hypothetical protein